MRAALLLCAALALSACDLSMTKQAKHEARSSPTLWPDGAEATASPDGTIAQDDPELTVPRPPDVEDDPARAAAFVGPPPVTPALLARGQERYGIFCAPCHGADGRGNGMIVQRGFPPPPSYLEPRLVAAPPAHIVDVVTNGYGLMYGFAERVEPADRWAIAAYVKALQRAGREQEAAR